MPIVHTIVTRTDPPLPQPVRAVAPQIFRGLVSGTYTVTATASGAHAFNGVGLTVKVITGAATVAQQVARGATANAAAANPPQLAITPNVTGSTVYGTVCDVSGTHDTTFTALASSTFFLNRTDALDFISFGSFKSASTTAGTPVTLGASAPTDPCHLALAEIVAATGLSLAEDPSAPPPTWVDGTLTVTSQPFTPPAGSLLVVMANGHWDGTAAIVMTVTSSGPALFWTQLSTDADEVASVWVAQIPPVLTPLLRAPAPPPPVQQPIPARVVPLSVTAATAIGLTDTGTAADSLTVVVTGSLGTLVETPAPPPVIPKPIPPQVIAPVFLVVAGLTDAGTATDALAVQVVQYGNVIVRPPLPPPAYIQPVAPQVIAVSAGAPVQVNLTDAGTAADSLAVQVVQTGNIVVSPLPPPPAWVKPVPAQVIAPVFLAVIALTDTATGTDTLAVTAAVALTDTGAGADTLTVVVVQLGPLVLQIGQPAPPPGTAPSPQIIAVLATGGPVQIALADTGNAADALAVVVLVALAETGTGSDALILAAPIGYSTGGGFGAPAPTATAGPGAAPVTGATGSSGSAYSVGSSSAGPRSG